MIQKQRNSICSPFFGLLLFIGIGLALRLVGIHKESLWWDEYASHVYVDAPSLIEFLKLNRTLDPLTLPAYYILEYGWFNYVSQSVVALRFMSILLGLTTLPFIFLIGRHLFGSSSGLLAVALVAVSPTLIHHSQSIRMYVLFVFLTATVVWTFITLIEKPRRSMWLIHWVASFILYWTHPFAGLVPATLGGFLLLCFLPRIDSRNFKAKFSFFVRWACSQSLLFAPTVVYLSQVRFWPQETTTGWIQRPSLQTLLADLLFDDITAFHWQFRLGDVALRLGNIRLVLDWLFAALLVVLLLFLCVRVFFSHRTIYEEKRRAVLLLLLWVVLPPTMLFALSWFVRPCMFPRYTVHCMLAVFLLIAGAVAEVRQKAWRWLLTILVIGLTVLQWAWLQPGPQRTDWRSAGLLLHEQAGHDDVVLVQGLLWRDVFVHNLKYMTPGLLNIPIAAAEKPPLLAIQAATCLSMLDRYLSSTSSSQAWAIVAMDYFEPGPPITFEQSLRAWDISFKRFFFPSIREIYVYQIHLSKPPSAPTMHDLLERWRQILPDVGWTNEGLDHYAMQAFGDLATQLALHEKKEMALEILEGIFDVSSFAQEVYGNLRNAITEDGDIKTKATAIKHLWDGYGFRDNGQRSYMNRAFHLAILSDPDHVLANLEAGLAFAQAGDYTLAKKTLAHVITLNHSYRDMLQSLIDALDTGVSVSEKIEAVFLYRKALMAIGARDSKRAEEMLTDALMKDPNLAAAQLMLGYVLTMEEVSTGTDTVLRQYLITSENPDIDAFAHMAIIQAEKNRPDLVRETLNSLFEKHPDAYKVYGSLLDTAASGQDLPLAAASIRFLWEGFNLLRKGREEAALTTFSKAIEKNPSNTLAQLEYGLGLAKRKELEKARIALGNAATQDPDYAVMLKYLLDDIEHGRDCQGSLAAVQAYRRGILAQSQGHYDNAVTYLEEAITADRRMDDAHTSRVFNLIILRRLDEALEGIERYLSGTETPSPGAYGLLAVIFIAQLKEKEAKEAVHTAVTMDASYAAQFGPLFSAILNDHDYEKAKAEMDRIKSQGIDLYPLMHDFVVAYLQGFKETSMALPDTGAVISKDKWADAIRQFVEEDRVSEPMVGGVLFTGSSTIRLWNLDHSFGNLRTLNRGFGGSLFQDIVRHAKAIVGPHQPDCIVVYSGDNDIASGLSPEQTAADGLNAIRELRSCAPRARIILLGIKPSPARWHYYPTMQQANQLMEMGIQELDRVSFVDLGLILMDEAGMPNPKFFVEDFLHLNTLGYELWSTALLKLLR